jgi:acyl carrier protein phosphodiesterase
MIYPLWIKQLPLNACSYAMNYLAHMYLAGDDDASVIGNFIADHVRGSDIETYSPAIQQGIRMHRAVDSFTDSHAVVRDSIMRLRPGYRKYAGVVVDMFYDHFLSAGWSGYCSQSLEAFTEERFRVLLENQETFPERAKYLLPFMVKHNWLKSYGTMEGMHRALTGMSRRTTFLSRMEMAIEELEHHYEDFKTEFETFFPDVIAFVKAEFPGTVNTR